MRVVCAKLCKMLIRQLVDPVSLFEEAHRVAAYGSKPQCLLLPCLEHDIQTTVVHWPILVGFYPNKLISAPANVRAKMTTIAFCLGVHSENGTLSRPLPNMPPYRIGAQKNAQPAPEIMPIMTKPRVSNTNWTTPGQMLSEVSSLKLAA